MIVQDYLDKQYNHAFDMVKFGETKNTVLIAFNGAIIVGMVKLASEISQYKFVYAVYYVIGMCILSIFISLAALIAKIRENPDNPSLPRSENILFFATLARMTHQELIKKIEEHYGCQSLNKNVEEDMAKQVIISSQIAVRKFKFFNIAIGFTLSALLTPLALIAYKSFFDHGK